jgi:glycosyltransferase involved in cell wall biosynthesis
MIFKAAVDGKRESTRGAMTSEFRLKARQELSIAIYLTDLRVGGAERLSVNLAKSFAARGMQVTFVLHQRVGELLVDVPATIEVVSLRAPRSLLALPRLMKFLRERQTDILLSQTGFNNIVAILAKSAIACDTRVVACQHSVLSAESAHHANWQHRLLPLLYRFLLGWADATVAVSAGVAADLSARAKIPRGRIDVIYNAAISPDFEDEAAVPVNHPWFDGSLPVLLAVGRLAPEKDFATLLYAFEKLSRRQRARLVVLGDGPEYDSLVRLSAKLGIENIVDFRGFEPNPFRYMKRAAALVSSSRYEGFGNVLVEALACGTAVISTDCPCGPAEILDGGRFGKLIPVGDVNALADAMECALFAGPDALASRARALEFALDPIADQYVALFDRIVSRAYDREAGRTNVEVSR